MNLPLTNSILKLLSPSAEFRIGFRYKSSQYQYSIYARIYCIGIVFKIKKKNTSSKFFSHCYYPELHVFLDDIEWFT